MGWDAAENTSCLCIGKVLLFRAVCVCVCVCVWVWMHKCACIICEKIRISNCGSLPWSAQLPKQRTTGWRVLDKRHLFSHRSGAWKWKIKFLAGLTSGQGSPELQIATFSLCAHAAFPLCVHVERKGTCFLLLLPSRFSRVCLCATP